MKESKATRRSSRVKDTGNKEQGRLKGKEDCTSSNNHGLILQSTCMRGATQQRLSRRTMRFFSS